MYACYQTWTQVNEVGDRYVNHLTKVHERNMYIFCNKNNKLHRFNELF